MEKTNRSKEFRDSLSIIIEDGSNKLKALEELGVIEKDEKPKLSAAARARSFIKSTSPMAIRKPKDPNRDDNSSDGR